MSYLLESTPADQLLVMIGDHLGERPEPYELIAPDDPNHWYGTVKGMPPRQGPGFCAINYTRNLHSLYSAGLIYESPHQYHVLHLTWRGWDRLADLRASGVEAPGVGYARHAMDVVEGRADDTGWPPREPESPRVSWWRRILSRATTEEDS